MAHFSNASMEQIMSVHKKLQVELGNNLNAEIEVKVVGKIMPPKAKRPRRKRFNPNAVCSCNPEGTTYEKSHIAHKEALKRNHKDNHNFFEDIKGSKKMYRTKIFGKTVIIDECDLHYYQGFKIEVF